MCDVQVVNVWNHSTNYLERLDPGSTIVITLSGFRLR